MWMRVIGSWTDTNFVFESEAVTFRKNLTSKYFPHRTVACPLGNSNSHVLVSDECGSMPFQPCVPNFKLDRAIMACSLLSNILAWLADFSFVPAGECL
jgi:hypothetical protein